ncbi:hypothetical protein BJY14_005831 [Actinomadura luteofluorescens]|uniref:Uncharacterized protein n=1 Tax=Actinomadura luteofluorescens TaxID=46163 RepID=A0A7Y9EL97_9ACTN|nr:hypothetical protein [Actinomadura luteofluorescens]
MLAGGARAVDAVAGIHGDPTAAARARAGTELLLDRNARG